MSPTTIGIIGIITFFGIGVLILILRSAYQKTSVNEMINDKVVLKIQVPLKNDKTPLAAEQLFQSIHGVIRNASKSKDHFSFEVVANHYGIHFIAVCNQRYKKFIENQIYAQYPEAQISYVTDYTSVLKNNSQTNIQMSELALKRESYLPIRTFDNFEVDPLASITGALAKLDAGYDAWIQILVRPLDNEWQKVGQNYVKKVTGKTDAEGNKIAMEETEKLEVKEIQVKNNKVGFQFIIRLLVKGPDPIMVNQILEDTEAAFKQYQTAQFNSLSKYSPPSGFLVSIKQFLLGKRKNDKLNTLQKFVYRFLDEKTEHIINIQELASIFHLPNETVKTPNISWAMSKKLEYPLNLPTKGSRIFALTDYRNIHIPFGIKRQDRKRHMYLLGKTGTGKSTMLKTLISGDILDGEGLAVIDPHGDLVEDILNLIPENRKDDVVLLDPSDVEYPVSLNMLDIKQGESKELLADGIVSVFKKYFDSWGPRLQYILTNTISTLLHCQNVSMLAILRILVDKNYRTFLLKQVKDPFIHKFWNEEFEAMSQNKRMLTEAISPIQNKVGRFLSSTMVRNMFGQVKSSIDLQEIMNSGKIFLVNLSQGKIGEENSSLLGGMIVTRLYTNAMQRALIPESQRKDFYLYVDEFQNFATDTFIKILSEARKYALNLVVTHQYIDQLSPEIQNAIFGNVGTLMNYVVGQQDANKLAEEYAPKLEPEDLVNMDRYRLAMKLTIDGAQSHPFTAIAMPPNFTEFGKREIIKQATRDQYSKPREVVEEKLNKWANQEYSKKGNLVIDTDSNSSSSTKTDNKKVQKNLTEEEKKKINKMQP